MKRKHLNQPSFLDNLAAFEERNLQGQDWIFDREPERFDPLRPIPKAEPAPILFDGLNLNQ